jgi:predicted phosphodiesterase
MANYNRTKAREVAIEKCREFPNHGDLTIAKLLIKDYPLLYTNVEHARTLVRNTRGHSGEKNRRQEVDKSLFKPVTNNTSPYNLPESFAEDFTPYKITSSRVLIISDLHFPYQDNKAITLALDYGKEKDVNCILINGDLLDFHNQSRFEKDPRARKTHEEFEAVRQFLRGLRSQFENCKIVFKLGNHDERWEKWLMAKAPELLGMSEFELQVILQLGELNIDIVKHKLPIEIGKLTVFHGHELNGSGGVNPARATFMKTIANVLIGHCHRSSQHSEAVYNGDVIVTTSQGCLCGMNPEYARVNKWNQGFAYVEQDVKTGEYNLLNLKINKGKIYV